MPAVIVLWCVAAFLGLALAGIGATAPAQTRSAAVYGGCLAVSALAFCAGLGSLVTGGVAATIVLPLGLPRVGAHFRVDLLAAFFLVVVNLGGGAASCYAIGYGRHEQALRCAARSQLCALR